ncbi:MAG: 16S rRNA processing protein RimM [Oscillospiraceae bacterium]|nr:16S rRNA processing protein RimM [Oscillospiraceae bacterium]
MEKQSFIDAGKIVNTHGVRGEVRIEVWLDSPALLKRCGRVYLGGEERKLLSAREHKGFLIAQLEGVSDVNAAQALKNRVVQIDRADAKLPRGAFFLQDIIGASVVDESGAEVGKLAEVLELPGQRVYVVKGETEHLIPAVPAFILNTDAAAGVITVRLIEGM